MINLLRVRIQIQSIYTKAQPSSDNERYVLVHTVTVRNLGQAPVRLLGRYWLVTNGNGRETEVQGGGVADVQPPIAPGKEYQYTNGATVETPLGTMRGHYEAINENGASLDIDTLVFRLAVPTLTY